VLNANNSKMVKAKLVRLIVSRTDSELEVKRYGMKNKKAQLSRNSSKTIKTTDFKFGTSVPRDSPDMTPQNFSKRGLGQGHVTP